jgi:hypothetical protein
MEDTGSRGTPPGARTEDEVLATLDRDGIVRLPELVTPQVLSGMQSAFEARLRRMRWNNSDGYSKTERYRHMVEDVLTLDQGFVDVALHPLVKGVLRAYLGDRYELTEAKGWRSLPTRKDFHGWHGDEWYDQGQVQDIPREVKLALYLTDVKTGAFHYVVGSHRKQHPRMLKPGEVDPDDPRTVQMVSSAGTAFLFDTSGIHRQGTPILEPRNAIFYNYHDPSVPLQQDNRDFYRYYPLLLNAAFLGGLSGEDQRILGFGNKTNFIPAYERRSGQELLEAFSRVGLEIKLRVDAATRRVMARIRRARKQLTARSDSTVQDRDRQV